MMHATADHQPTGVASTTQVRILQRPRPAANNQSSNNGERQGARNYCVENQLDAVARNEGNSAISQGTRAEHLKPNLPLTNVNKSADGFRTTITATADTGTTPSAFEDQLPTGQQQSFRDNNNKQPAKSTGGPHSAPTQSRQHQQQQQPQQSSHSSIGPMTNGVQAGRSWASMASGRSGTKTDIAKTSINTSTRQSAQSSSSLTTSQDCFPILQSNNTLATTPALDLNEFAPLPTKITATTLLSNENKNDHSRDKSNVLAQSQVSSRVAISTAISGVKKPHKTYQERADEYAKARLRILGSASSDDLILGDNDNVNRILNLNLNDGVSSGGVTGGSRAPSSSSSNPMVANNKNISNVNNLKVKNNNNKIDDNNSSDNIMSLNFTSDEFPSLGNKSSR